MNLDVWGKIIGYILTGVGILLAVIEKKKMKHILAGIGMVIIGVAIIFHLSKLPETEIDSEPAEGIEAEHDTPKEKRLEKHETLEKEQADNMEPSSDGEAENDEVPDGESINDDTNIVSSVPEITETADMPEAVGDDSLEELESAYISLAEADWKQDKKVYKDTSAATIQEECIVFGSSNINADGLAYIIVDCKEYSRFTAEITPQEGFDKSEEVIFSIYGHKGEIDDENKELIPLEELRINCLTSPINVDYDISNVDYIYFYKDGNYSRARIAGQYINGYSGMGVVMRGAALYK